jgi:hypothetical protein
MAGSTYSTNLKIELQATGENSGTWGTITNTNLGTALEQAIVGYGNPEYLSDATLTISLSDSNAAQTARALVLNVTSVLSLTVTRELVVPTIQKQYIVQNNTTGGQSITVKTSGGTGITVPNGRKAHLYVDGTNVIQMFDFVDINGGAIDGTTVGAASASTGAFTTLTASGATTLNGAVALGDAAGDLITVPGTVNSNVIFTDNTYDIGASGATRPRTGYFGTSVISPLATLTNAQVTNIKANDGTAVMVLTNSTGALDISTAVTMSATTQNIALGTSQTTGNFTIGGTSQSGTIGIGGTAATGAITLDASTKTHTLNIGTGATENATTKTINIGTGGVSGSTTTITIGSTNGTTTTVNGTLNATTLDLTNLEVTNIKAKDGTAAMSIADSTGVVSITANPILSGGTANGVVYLNASKVATTGSALTFDGANFVNTSSSVGTPEIAIQNSATSAGANARLRIKAGGAGPTTYGDAFIQFTDSLNWNWSIGAGSSTSNALVFTQYFGLGSNELMRLTSAGTLNIVGAGTAGSTQAISFNGAAPVDSLVVNSSGNVGIGTSSITYRTEIWQDANSFTGARIRNNDTGSSAYAGLVLNANGNTWSMRMGSSAANSNALQLVVDQLGTPTVRATLSTDGNLGLGVTPSTWSATSKAFQIGATGAIRGRSDANLVNLMNNFYTDTGGTNRYINTDFATNYQQTSGQHQWYTAASGFGYGTAATSLTSTQNGNSYTIVTAGTTDFTLIGAANNNVGTTFTKSGGTGAGTGTVSQNISFSQKMTLDSDGTFRVKGAGTAGSTDAVQFSGSAPAESLKLDSSGNLLVGTSTTISKLTVFGTGNQFASIISATGSSTQVGINLSPSLSAAEAAANPAQASIYAVDSNYSANIIFANKATGAVGNALTERARITSGGEFLINTANASGTSGVGVALNPTANGVRTVSAATTSAAETYSMYSTGAAAYRFYVDWAGTVYATNTTISAISDQRFKENIRDLDVGLDAIMALKPRKFDWKDGKGKDKKDDRGFVAQEFEQVFPDLIDEWKDPAPEGEEPYKSVRQDLIPVLVKAIQEQQAMIKTLEAKIAALEQGA